MRKIRIVLRSILYVAAAAVFLTGTAMAWKIYRGYQIGRDTYKILKDTYTSVPEHGPVTENSDEGIEGELVMSNTAENENAVSDKEEEELPPDAPARIKVDWGALEKLNPDVAAWITLPAVDLSYPVVQGEDNDYYLHRSLNREYLFAGCIFLDWHNSPEFKNYNSIIYGHNMRDGSMFANLKQYNDSDVLEACPYFWIYTPKGDILFRIFSVHNAAGGSDTYTVRFADFQSNMDWLGKMQEMSVLDTGIDITESRHKVVTLSTCTGDQAVCQVVQGAAVASANIIGEEHAG